ncbi:MAG: TetR/AcrR family transcriptional regulator [Chthoniobacterales bacterium]
MKTEQVRSAKWEETRLRILSKADELFRQYGFMKTTIADIAHDLGMSTANIYKFFPSRSALVESCAERNVSFMQSEIAVIIGQRGSAMNRMRQCILKIFHFHEELFRNERQIFKLVVEAIEEGWPCIQKFDEFLLENFTRLVREGVATKEFSSTQPAKTASVLLDCLAIALHPHMRHGRIDVSDEIRINAMMTILGKALR